MMPTERYFQKWTYLTLGFACLCLGYSEREYLPEVSAFAGVVAVGLIVSYLLEGTVALSLTAANWVGGAIFLIAGIWIAYHWRYSESLIHTLPWPSGLLPYMAPLLMVLMPAKLFRPKHVGDWWAMHGVGLSSVCVAASLEDDVWFVLFLGLYSVAGLVSLTLFFQLRTASLLPPVPPSAPGSIWDLATWVPIQDRNAQDVRPSQVVTVATSSTRRLRRFSMMLRPLRWFFVTGLLTIPLFYLTPRSSNPRWSISPVKMETGLGNESSVDLRNTGTLEQNTEVAFEVLVRDGQGQYASLLPMDQLWRATSFLKYEEGKWQFNSNPQRVDFIPDSERPRIAPQQGQVPYFGPQQMTLEYDLRESTNSVVLACPITYDTRQNPPLRHVVDDRMRNGVKNWDCSFVPLIPVTGKRPTRYQQVTLPQKGSVRGIPFLKENHLTPTDVFGLMRTVPGNLQELRRWSRELLNTMIERGRLPAAIHTRRSSITDLPDESDHRQIALAFQEFLAQSPDYRYSLELTRKNRLIDPIEDFLFHTKAGHCERYATALVLMLRSVGIPSQFVVGFKGCEQIGEGHYSVRHDMAHAWVEIIVPHTDPIQAGKFEWFMLDPTPADEGTVVEPNASLWSNARTEGQKFFSEYIVGLNPQSQKKAVQAVSRFMLSIGPWLVLFVAGAG
ncbi:MAG: transglutaminaseTgpA domain-containing protein, partial [Gemmataceae bacterium]